MSEAAQTLEGWYALHDFRAIDWKLWKTVPAEQRIEIITEFQQAIENWKQAEQNHIGSTAVYSVLGHKGDFVFMHLREDLQTLGELETAFNKLQIADYLYSTYSYVSVVELSNYMSKPGSDPMENPEVVARLKPTLPEAEHICFYPMNKRREGNDNWYMLGMDERREMMRSHGMIGRKYAGKIKQIITGSVGFDDWEWGVTLFAEDALQFKKLIYEMRFDEVSARYGDFGDFYVGNRLTAERIQQYLAL